MKGNAASESVLIPFASPFLAAAIFLTSRSISAATFGMNTLVSIPSTNSLTSSEYLAAALPVSAICASMAAIFGTACAKGM